MSGPRVRLIVEGKVDQIAICQILMRRNINPQGMAGRRVQVELAASGYEEKEPGGGISRLFERLETEEKTARTGEQVVGYVADADSDAAGLYEFIRRRFASVGLKVPTNTASGFLEKSRGGAWVGGWVMPDNSSPGSLEKMLLGMRTGSQDFIAHAREATHQAFKLNKFKQDARPQGLKAVDLEKAELHAYLAWHRKPSLNFGMSFDRKRLDADAPAADGFVEWVQRLLGKAEA